MPATRPAATIGRSAGPWACSGSPPGAGKHGRSAPPLSRRRYRSTAGSFARAKTCCRLRRLQWPDSLATPHRGGERTDVSRDCGNLTVDHQALLAAVGDHCLQLDPATGRTLATYDAAPAPKSSGRLWGYVGLAGDRLIGTRTTAGGTSRSLFAVELPGGKYVWSYAGTRISHPSISIGDGTVFFVDLNSDSAGQRRAAGAQGSPPRVAASGSTAGPGPGGRPGCPQWRGSLAEALGPVGLPRRGDRHDVWRRRADHLRRLHRRPLLATVLSRRAGRTRG